jgi:phage terminase large subunit-like protein
VCALDPGDDPLAETACHIKTNPNLGVSIHPAYLADQVATARHIPAETNLVLRLNFCVWTQSHASAWDMAKWREAPPFPPESALLGARCLGGLDLGQVDDFAAWVLLWALDDGTCAVRARFWLPRAALDKYPNRPYAEWERAGILTVTEGDTTDLDLVEATVIADAREAGVIEIGYDKRFAQHLALHLQGAGLTAVDCPQGFALNESIQSIAKLVADGALRHGDHAILSWMMDNTVLRAGRNREVRLDKEAAKDKIDGVAALVMANARRLGHPEAPSYQMFVFGGRP